MIGTNTKLTPMQALSRRYLLVARVVLVAAVGIVALTVILPIHGQGDTDLMAAMARVRPLPNVQRDLGPLKGKMAGAPLIKPAQIQAAVKDDGTAKALAAKLKLQGVVQMGAELVAYIAIESRTTSVKEGGMVLDFTVTKIETNQVTLNLNGVEVILGH